MSGIIPTELNCFVLEEVGVPGIIPLELKCFVLEVVVVPAGLVVEELEGVPNS